MIKYARTPEQKARIAEDIMNSVMPLSVDIQEGDIRTIKQNARYWAGVITGTQEHLEHQTGNHYSKEDIHNYFKTERYGKKVAEINGKVCERVARSSKMTVKQFAKFSEWAEAHAITVLGVPFELIDGYARW